MTEPKKSEWCPICKLELPNKQEKENGVLHFCPSTIKFCKLCKGRASHKKCPAKSNIY